MRKFLVTILSIIYLTTTTGFTLNLHYCMGKPVNWAWWSVDADKCSKCGMANSVTKDKGCCTDEPKQIRLESDQKMGLMAFKFLQLPPSVPLSFIEVPSHILTSTKKDNPANNAPPLCSSIAVYITHCVYFLFCKTSSTRTCFGTCTVFSFLQ